MATTNVTITSDWTKVAEDTDDPVLIQPADPGADCEIATVATDTDPTVSRGHFLSGAQCAVTREIIGGGFVYARNLNGNSMTMVVTL